MPKVLVLFVGAEGPAVSLAEAAADGARGVRFTEVEVVAAGSHDERTLHRHPHLASIDGLRHRDGIVIACAAAGEVPPALEQLFDAMESIEPPAFTNAVVGVVGGDRTMLLDHLARLGGIMIGESQEPADPEARARQLGARVAKVAGWVRHALSHEAH